MATSWGCIPGNHVRGVYIGHDGGMEQSMELSCQHVGMYCRDIDESIAFYEDVLGCRLLFKSEAMEGDVAGRVAWRQGTKALLRRRKCSVS